MSLCPDADRRAAMTDDEFWQDVAENLGHPAYDDDRPDLDVSIAVVACAECGSQGACDYDAEGRPLIHAIEEEA